MNRKQRGFLYGLCFGDGCVSKQHTNKNYGLTVGHGPKQKAYLQHKAQRLNSVFGGKPVNINTYQSTNKQTQKTYTNFQFRKTHPYFNQIHRNLYPTGQKVFSRKVLDYLTIEGLAYWIMDDGSGRVIVNKQGRLCGCMLRISTYCSQQEADTIAKWFYDKYSITAKFDVDRRNGRVSIRFGTLDSVKLAKIIHPYVIPEMLYKIDGILSYTPRVLDPTIVGEDIV